MRTIANKALCLFLVLTMIVGLLPATMFAGAASVVVMGTEQMLVDDDFSSIANGKTATATVGGITYQAVMGTNAFATIAEALTRAKSDNQIYVAAGRYEEKIGIPCNIEMYGNGMNVNPNNADWSLNTKRSNEKNETLIIGDISVQKMGLSRVVVNGFSLTGKTGFIESTFQNTITGLDFCNNYIYPTDLANTNGIIYFSNTSSRSGRIANNRIDATQYTKTNTVMAIGSRNPDHLVIEGNYVIGTAINRGVWLTAEINSGNTLPSSIKKSVVRNNYFDIAANVACVDIVTAYAEEIDVTIEGNELIGARGINFDTKSAPAEASTPDKKISIIGNTFRCTNQDIRFNSVSTNKASLLKVKNNKFSVGLIENGNIASTWTTYGIADFSYNYFPQGSVINFSPMPILYPMYTDEALTKVEGEMKLDNVSLTAVADDGDKTSSFEIVVDNENRTVTVEDTLPHNIKAVEIEAIAKEQVDSTVQIEYYADEACTKALTDGNVLNTLKKGENRIYIKLITSMDNYSHKVYTLTFAKEAAQGVEVLGVEDYSATITDDKIDVVIPATDVNPNIRLNVSANASYVVYTDSELQNAMGGTVFYDLPVGTTTYYVVVTAEDGKTTKTYALNLTREAKTDAEIVEILSPQFVEYDDFEEAYLGVYTNKVETATVDIKVSESASWKAYKDFACTVEAEINNIPLSIGDTVLYIRVASEKEAEVKVYKLILRRENAAASKEIFAVTSAAKSYSVGRDTVAIKIASTVTEYAPAFDFAGSYWKIYSKYEHGSLSGEVSGNTFKNITGGKHTYYIQVVDQNGKYRVYTLVLEREPSKEAKLIAIGGGKEFYVDRFDFIATTLVQNEGAFVPTFEISTGATIEIKRGNQAVDLPIILRPGVNEYTIVVVAEDGVTTNQYAWSIECIGDGTTMLTEGVVLSEAWAGYADATPVYATINGEIYKAYYGENAFSDFNRAKAAAATKGGIIYVMSGTTIAQDIAVSGIKLYGPNFSQDANIGSRYPESTIKGVVTIAGAGTTVSGFTFAENASVVVKGTSDIEISNNIFADMAENADIFKLSTANTAYNKITVKGNLFDVNTDNAILTIPTVGTTFVISNNVFNNAGVGAAIVAKKMVAGSTLEIADNTFDSVEAIAVSMEDADERDGYLYIHNNVFESSTAISLDASKAAATFVVNFNNNEVETAKIAVVVKDAPATFATAFTANENTFANIKLSFMVEYASDVNTAGLSAMDISRNYYSTATPGNDLFDTTYKYKPYYLNAEKTALSNVVNAVKVTANGQDFIDDGFGKYAVVSTDEAEVNASFVKDNNIIEGTYGTVYVSQTKNQFMDDFAFVSVNPKAIVYVTVFSHDMTVSKTEEVVVYKQSTNPIYSVNNVLNYIIKDMSVKIVVEHDDTEWTPNLSTFNALPVTLYTDAACTVKANIPVALPGDSTTVYGKVEGFEPVKITLYRKLSSEKVIFSIKDAYTFEYTGADKLNITVDNRLTVADLSAEVSGDAFCEVFADAALSVPVDETKVASNVTKLYYKVTAADDSAKVYEVSIAFVKAVDPIITAVANATILRSDKDFVNAKVNSYDETGFTVKLTVPAGCTYVLYADAAHKVILKNNTTFFASNYVNVYAAVTSPDGVVTNDYTIKLEKAADKIIFVDAIPEWAKNAVEFTKDLGIVTGTKVTGGYKFDAAAKTTREMMACFIVRMMGVDVTQFAYVDLTATFDDADKVSNWALSSMKAAVELGYFSGSKDGDKLLLNPTDNISREQFTVVFVRAIGAVDTDIKGYTLKYSDAAKISEWATNYVKIISKLGLMQGSDGKFQPTNSITRAEIIQTIYSYMK